MCAWQQASLPVFDGEVMDEPVYTDRHSPARSRTQRAYIIKTRKRRETTSLAVWRGLQDTILGTLTCLVFQ